MRKSYPICHDTVIRYHRLIKSGEHKGSWVITEEFRVANLREFRMTRNAMCDREAHKLKSFGETVVTWTEEISRSL